MRRKIVNPESIGPPAGAYSHSVVIDSGDAAWIYISGQVALDPEGNVVGEGDMGAQATAVMDNVQAILEANGATFTDVVKMTWFLTDMSRIGEVREVRSRYLVGEPPASTAVEVNALVRPELLLEVEAVAVVGR